MKSILSIVLALVIGAGGGYVTGKGAVNTQGDVKKLQDVTSMMNEQSASIKQMSEMMKTTGLSIQDMGMKYKDDTLVSEGKDLQAVGEKYLKENTTKATEGGMRQMMP
ncbi:MAG: hypothetical protein Q8L52_03425 [bacterium]|nr:hypothetical protein [bacterium]